MTPIEGVLYLILPSAAIGWVFRRFGLVDVAGFVIGGVFSYYLLSCLNLNVDEIFTHVEIIQQLGLLLFFFEIGSSIDLRGILASSYIVTSSELVLLVLAWISTGLLSNLLGLGFHERVLLFVTLLNSSTAAIVSMRRLKLGREIFERAVLQTSLEDVVQLSLFTALVFSASERRMLNLATDLVTTAGRAIMLFLIARTVFMLLGKSPFTKTREDKFFTLLITAVAFSALSSIMGLPELYGALVAGVASSLYMGLDDVRDFLGGVRDLGLLLYFAGIGLFIAPWTLGATPHVVIASFLLATVSLMVRLLGCSIGFILSGVDFYSSILVSIVLSQISETGIVLAYTMHRAGLVGGDFVVIVVLSVLLTMIASSIASTRAPLIALWAESRLPSSLHIFLQTTSKIFFRRVEVLVKSLALLSWFSAVALIVTTVASLVVQISIHVGLPPGTVSMLTLASTLILFLIHAAYTKLISDVILNFSSVTPFKPLHALETLFDVAMGLIIVALQIYLVSEFVLRVSHATPYPESMVYYIASGVTITATVLSVLRRVKRSPPERTSSERTQDSNQK